VRVLELELARAAVHLAVEALAGAGDALGERDGGVVAGLEQQAAQQVGDLHPLAGKQADLGLDRRRPVARRREGLAELGVLERDQRGHQLRGRADAQALVGLALADDGAGLDLDHDRGLRAHARRAVARVGGGREQEERRHDGERPRSGAPHRSSTIF
jgi:hypothetical protein